MARNDSWLCHGPHNAIFGQAASGLLVLFGSEHRHITGYDIRAPRNRFAIRHGIRQVLLHMLAPGLHDAGVLVHIGIAVAF